MKAVMPFCFFRLLPEGMPQQALGAGGRGAYKIAQAIKKGGTGPGKPQAGFSGAFVLA